MVATELSMHDLDQVCGARDFSSAIDRMEGQLDALNEISSTAAQRLQMVMDTSVGLGPLSNFLKQIGGTQSAVTQNLR
jgi:hypothetical protein